MVGQAQQGQRVLPLHGQQVECRMRIEGTKVLVPHPTEDMLRILDLATSYFVKDYQYIDSYRDGRWDGKTRLGEKRKDGFSFPLGLLTYVMQRFETYGYSVSLEDTRERPQASIPPLMDLEGIELWDHQERAVRTALTPAVPGDTLLFLSEERAVYLHGGEGNVCRYRIPHMGILWIATGGGKTESIAALIGQLAVPTLFVVYGVDLVDQTFARFASRFGDWLAKHGKKMGIIGDGVYDPGFITVASISSLAAMETGYDSALEEARNVFREAITSFSDMELGQKTLRSFVNRWKISTMLDLYDELKEKEPDQAKLYRYHLDAVENNRKRQVTLRRLLAEQELLVYDEAHGAGSESGYDISMKCPAYYRIALSATPLDRSDSNNWKVIGAFGDPIVRVRTKELVEKGILPKAEIFLVRIDGDDDGRWPACYKSGIVEHEYRTYATGVIARHHSLVLGERVLILFQRKKHGRVLLQQCGEMGLKCCLLDGGSSRKARKEGVQGLNNGTYNVLIASDIFKQGLDAPLIDVVVIAPAGKATIDTMQRFGRGLRGENLTVYDYADGHNPKLAEHSRDRLQIYIDYDCFPINWADIPAMEQSWNIHQLETQFKEKEET